jgi:anti-sigma factor RsiW
MEERREEDRDDEDLPRRFRFAGPRGTGGGGPDPNLLAAWLDGTASPGEEDEVERALLADPAALEAARALREAAGEATPEVSAEAVARIREALARSLAPAAAAPPRGRTLRIWKLAAAAALVLFAAFLGFRMGQDRLEEGATDEDAIVSELTGEWAYGFRESAWFTEE